MKKNVTNLMLILAAATMTACSSHDLYDGGALERDTKASYTENFTKKYPEVNLNQSFDFSTKQATYSLGTVAGSRTTRAGQGGYTMGDWYEVDNNTLSWMHEQLVEGKDNRKLGKPFYMRVPNNDFTIVPIFQGIASAMWNLHVVVDGVDYKIWEKINNESLGGTDEDPANEYKTGTIQIKDADNNEWHNLHGQWFDWGYGHWNALYNTDGSDRWTPDWKDKNKVTAVKARTYTFSGLPAYAEMYFYLEITESGNGEEDGVMKYRNTKGAQESSLKGMMLALEDCPVPANLDGNEAMIIGCEDADLDDSDWDLNDLVLLVYGKQVPKPEFIEEGDAIEEVTTVRYMIEDLGATDDFDFNDIVVDVSNIRTLTPNYKNGEFVESWNEKGTRQEAVIRHLGGVLPFRLTIGNTVLDEHVGVLGSDPNEKFDVTGWDINAHNVSVEVRQTKNATVYNHVTFPKAGEAPMIIAVDPSQKWMNERQSVPSSWFTIPE